MKLLFIFFLLFTIALTDGIPLGPTPDMPTESSDITVISKLSMRYPEEIAIDPTGTFYLTGTADGYVYKVILETNEVSTFLTPRDFNPEHFEEMTDEEIESYCDGDQTQTHILEPVCGRVLGIKFFMNKKKTYAYIVNSYFGIWELRFKKNGKHKMKNIFEQTGVFLNDVYRIDDKLYYTNSHTSVQRYAVINVVLDPNPIGQGSFNVYDMDTNEHTTLIDGLFFANGITLSSDESFFYISETDAARIVKYEIATGETSYLVENLPVLTDNIYLEKSELCDDSDVCSNDGTLVVPGYHRVEGLDDVLRDFSAMAEFLTQNFTHVVVPTFKSWIKPVGTICEVDEATGEITKMVFSNGFPVDPDSFLLAASAHKLGTNEYITGSVFYPAVFRFQLNE
ncbi:strictosidine synthase-related [Anaeramoeba flamelloides]|uniref:Strictosidine synthase-related n=1 Tax=Anaeramoeba flamelloides TaxID=1746091 RepID=A0AAV7Z241_9EUKA|nr:strictosidine synthase-related [Anaeramoeba flamelloides]